MTALPAAYAWLNGENGPRMLVEMLHLYGTRERVGPGSNPEILSWAKEVGVPYPDDSVAWCGLTVSIAAKRASWEYKPNGNPLWARNWAEWGTPQKTAKLGDVLVFPRGTGGHVALYVGEDDNAYHILGGNQSDAVSFARKPKNPIIAIRRAPWRIAEPANVRIVHLKSTGAPISTKET
jgi:uncharacterized protein (TIGR02594 family)